MKISPFLQITISLCSFVAIESTLLAGKNNDLPIPRGAKVGPGRIIPSTSATTSWQCPYKNCKHSPESLERIIKHCDRRHYHLHFMVCTGLNGEIAAVSKQYQSHSVVKATITGLANTHPHINATIECDQERLECLKEKICGIHASNVRMRKPMANPHTLQYYKSLIPITPKNQPIQAQEHQAIPLSQDALNSTHQQTPGIHCQTHDFSLESSLNAPDNTTTNAQQLLQSMEALDHEPVKWLDDQDFTPPAPTVPPLFW